MKGLAKLDDMPETTALHIPRCRSVHTFTMRFPLDLIWLDKAGHVVRVDPSVPPRRLKSCLRARSVIEARGGTADTFLAAGLVATPKGSGPFRYSLHLARSSSGIPKGSDPIRFGPWSYCADGSWDSCRGGVDAATVVPWSG